MRNDKRYSSWSDAAKREKLASDLVTLDVLCLIAKDAYQFYTSDGGAGSRYPARWNPWGASGRMVETLRDVLPKVQDETLRELCRPFAVQAEEFNNLDEDWRRALAGFLGLAVPTRQADFENLHEKMESYRRKRGAEWAKREEFRSLVEKTQRVVVESEQIWGKLHARLMELYGDVLLEPGELGDQRAKDLIDRSYGVEAKKAIPLLERALRYGRTGLQASKAFKEQGNRYDEQGEPARAIEYYTQSIKAFRLPDPITFFWRGVLYYQQSQWKEARSDFERALASGLNSPEREQAQEYLSKMEGVE